MYSIARLGQAHQGYALVDAEGSSLLYIDGNYDNPDIPAALVSIDPHVVYGFSHPSIISKILGSRPQTLLTTKKLAHALFEHGMKGAWGQISLGEISFLTTLNTFYKNVQQASIGGGTLVTVAAYPDENKAYIDLTIKGKRFIISTSHTKAVEEEDVTHINLNLVRDYIALI